MRRTSAGWFRLSAVAQLRRSIGGETCAAVIHAWMKDSLSALFLPVDDLRCMHPSKGKGLVDSRCRSLCPVCKHPLLCVHLPLGHVQRHHAGEKCRRWRPIIVKIHVDEFANTHNAVHESQVRSDAGSRRNWPVRNNLMLRQRSSVSNSRQDLLPTKNLPNLGCQPGRRPRAR